MLTECLLYVGQWWRVLQLLFNVITALWSRCAIMPILQMRKSRLKDTKTLDWDHAPKKRWRWDSDPWIFDSKDCAFSVSLKQDRDWFSFWYQRNLAPVFIGLRIYNHFCYEMPSEETFAAFLLHHHSHVSFVHVAEDGQGWQGCCSSSSLVMAF